MEQISYKIVSVARNISSNLKSKEEKNVLTVFLDKKDPDGGILQNTAWTIRFAPADNDVITVYFAYGPYNAIYLTGLTEDAFDPLRILRTEDVDITKLQDEELSSKPGQLKLHIYLSDGPGLYTVDLNP